MLADRINRICGLRGNHRHTIKPGASLATVFDNDSSQDLKIEVSWKRLTSKDLDGICRLIAEGDAGALVKVVHLSDNDLGPQGAQKVVTAMNMSGVQDLLLCFNDVGREGCDALSNIVSISVNLRLLDLRGNGLTPRCVHKLLKAVAVSTSLKRLGLGSNKLGPEGAALLARKLEKNTYLTSLDISLNEIGPGGAKPVAKLIEGPECVLECVQLYGNRLGPEGVSEILAAVKKNRSIKQLTLGNNHATDAVAANLAAMLRENTSLERLDIRLNTLTAAAVRVFAQDGLAQNSVLRSLCLAGNPLDSIGGEDISQALILSQVTVLSHLDLSSCQLGPIGGMRIANLIGTSSTITDVNLSDNKLDDEASASLANSILNGVSISSLNLSANEIGEWSASNLIEATQRNFRMMSLVLHGNKINRTVQKKIDTLLEERLARKNAECQRTSSSRA